MIATFINTLINNEKCIPIQFLKNIVYNAFKNENIFVHRIVLVIISQFTTVLRGNNKNIFIYAIYHIKHIFFFLAI